MQEKSAISFKKICDSIKNGVFITIFEQSYNLVFNRAARRERKKRLERENRKEKHHAFGGVVFEDFGHIRKGLFY